MTGEAETIELLSVNIHLEQDVVLCRQHARQFAVVLGFDTQTQTRIATAVSEIARNAYQYAGGGEAIFSVETELDGVKRFDLRRQSLVISISDRGRGIANLDQILAGNYRSPTGMGLGVVGARRLMDVVEIESGSKGTSVLLKKNLPPSTVRKNVRELRALAVTQEPKKEASLMAEVQLQNRELLTVMEEVRSSQDDLGKLNKELEETNAGVLALYDELETLHRVGLLLASKVNLPSVIQALIEATTDLTGAEFGACFLYAAPRSEWQLYANAGPRKELFDGLVTTHGKDFFGDSFGQDGLIHIPDLQLQTETCCVTKFGEFLEPNVALRSCLAVPLINPDSEVMGALVFGSAAANIFSERSERIVASIAAQAIVAVEKARMFDSVKAASEAKDRFLAMISHELRTPLNPVLNIISSMHQDGNLPPEIREDIAIVLRNVQLEARLIDDLLDFQRIIKGNIIFDSAVVEMHSTIRNVVEICGLDLTSRSQKLTLALEAEKTLVMGDSARLQQILWNVLKNAIKFTPKGGAITISTAVEAGNLFAARIVDTGRGIEANFLQEIFSAFDQGSVVGATEFGGLGLGLAIVKSFVEKQGGSVVAESPGRDAGTTIIIRFPLHSEADKEEISPRLDAVEAYSQPDLSKKRVLLVEDHVDTLDSLAKILTKKNYDVTKSTSSAEALAHVKVSKFDMIVSDLGLPDGGGLELIEKIRLTCDTPAIALSGFGMESDLDKSRTAGFQRHLTKPVSIPDLTRAMEELLAN